MSSRPLSSSHNNTSRERLVLRRPPSTHVRDAVVDSDSDEAPSHREEGGASSSRRNHHHGVDETKTNQSRAIVSHPTEHSRIFNSVRGRVFDAQRARENERDETRPGNIKQRRNKQQRCYQNERYFRWSNRCCRTTWE